MIIVSINAYYGDSGDAVIVDGKDGLIFHFLECLYYRFMVDVNIYDLERQSKSR
jgi:hypothetical protein